MNFDVVGKSILRVDGKAKVTGQAIYPQDIYMDGMLYGKTLRSTKPHAYIKVDVTKAENIKGVVKVFTAKDIPGLNGHGVMLKDHEVFCSKKVRRIGDPIAFVVAETEEIAIEALKHVEVEYDVLPAVFDPEKALEKDAPRIHDDMDNLLYHFKLRKGLGKEDINKAFEECEVIAENTYTVPQIDHAFLQPEAGVAYVEDDGTLVVAYATQYQHFDKMEIAEVLGVPMEKIKLINCAIGGAFGGREDATAQIHISLAAHILKRPVKTVYSRKESFIAHSKRHAEKIYMKTGALKDGTLHAVEARIIGDSGAYVSWAFNVLRKSGVHATGPYVVPNVKVDSMAVSTNNPFAGAMRGFGAIQVTVAYEQQMDILAEKLGISTVDIRMKNLFKEGSITATGQVLTESVPIVPCLEGVIKDIDFSAIQYPKEVINEVASTQSKQKCNIKRGKGISCAYYGTGYGNGFPDVSEAHVELGEDGKITIFVAAAEVGQGAKTVMSQIAAEVLGVDFEDTIIISEDTSLTVDSGTAAASRQTYNTGNAVKRAAENLKKELIEIAKEELKLNSDVGYGFKNSSIFLKVFPSKQITFKEIAEKRGKIRAGGKFTAQTVEMDEDGQGVPYWPYTFSACSVEVEVDTETGNIKVVDATHAQDVGRALNPRLIEGQMDGGFAMGLGYALFEEIILKEGSIVNNRFTNYVIPSSTDVPRVKNVIIEDPENTAPFGAKGIGEPTMLAVPGAILNAIYDAVGVRITDIPATPDKILKALKEKDKNS
ncbi:xanthine dehydrogenase family protein molybdopterin-binding subunit [Clostridium cylindrosporum]|uniref:Putative xanthine dehydrogenase subunit D n=1 Tax=Clostridium cylindrosporum DSM 605 TaxID=1121307 RepID=A0A0J8D895_CLOCY|nr:molybdopterin cofactor-binding domain-containing protein [Clostridium cylindrosporum]KMT22087.1 putative xanthine dehydrogenase subunit D [Clostridium cylindrosporum DSM 605]